MPLIDCNVMSGKWIETSSAIWIYELYSSRATFLMNRPSIGASSSIWQWKNIFMLTGVLCATSDLNWAFDKRLHWRNISKFLGNSLNVEQRIDQFLFGFRWFSNGMHPFTKQDDWLYSGGFWDGHPNTAVDIFWVIFPDWSICRHVTGPTVSNKKAQICPLNLWSKRRD